MALEIERENNKFRIKTQYFITEWIPDTPANRKTMVVLLRLLENIVGKKLFTFQELAQITLGTTANAAMKAVKQFEEKGRDFHQLHLYHKPKINEEVIETIKEIVQQEPLESLEEIARKANAKLNCTDINRWHIEWVLAEYVTYYEIRKVISKRLENGEYNYKEEYVMKQLWQMALQNGHPEATSLIPVAVAQKEPDMAAEPIGVGISEQSTAKIPDNAKEIFRDEATKEKLSEIWKGTLGLYMFSFILYYHGVSLSVIGRWLGVNKSTVCRWLAKLANWSKPWVDANHLLKAIDTVKSIAVDEKWIYIDGVVWYLFVAVDCVTGYPLHSAIYPGNGISYCKLFLLELKNKGYCPKAIVTDGWNAYITAIEDIFPNTEHLLCRFHAIKRVFWRLQNEAHISAWSIIRAVAKLFKSPYKKTVKARLEKLSTKLEEANAGYVLTGLKAKMPTLLKAVGSLWRPSTTNAAEGFFSHFDRFYKLKGPFPDLKSAQKHLQLFMLGYLFNIGATWQPCPLEKAGYDVKQVPFYHLFNLPDVVTLKQHMAA